eukprot:1377248-Heterocapsa_arctica.AAC.1
MGDHTGRPQRGDHTGNPQWQTTMGDHNGRPQWATRETTMGYHNEDHTGRPQWEAASYVKNT